MAGLHKRGQRGIGSKEVAPEIEIDRWLERATRRLPSEIRDDVRDELECHYLDALDDYLKQGLSKIDAHRAVMRDLGSEDDTAGALRGVHYSTRYYQVGLVSSTIYPLCYFGYLGISLFIGYHFVLEPIYYLVGVLFSTLVLFYCFRQLLANQISFSEDNSLIDESMVTIGIGLVLAILVGFVGWVVFDPEWNRLPYYPPGGLFIRVDTLVGYAADAGSVMAGLALVILGFRLASRQDVSLVLIRVVAALMVVIGIVILANMMSYIFELNTGWEWYLEVVSELMHLLICGVLAIVFLQALLKERSGSPLQAA